MSTCVVDASAIVAFLNGEPGGEITEEWFDRGAIVSALNIQEVISRLMRDGISRSHSEEAIAGLGIEVRNLTWTLALEGGAMAVLTRPRGLSHGDRACLALAKQAGVPAVTADRAWAEVAEDIGVEIVLVR